MEKLGLILRKINPLPIGMQSCFAQTKTPPNNYLLCDTLIVEKPELIIAQFKNSWNNKKYTVVYKQNNTLS